MNRANLQDKKSIYKNEWHFYTETTSYLKKTFFLSPFAIASKKIKYLGINLTKEWKSYTLKTIKNWLSKSKMTQINRKIFYVHVLEEY